MKINGYEVKTDDLYKYVESLRCLLSKPPNFVPRYGCPQGFSLYNHPENRMNTEEPLRCHICIDFISGNYYQYLNNGKCPCNVLGSKDSVKSALFAIWQFDQGVHKWQKGEK